VTSTPRLSFFILSPVGSGPTAFVNSARFGVSLGLAGTATGVSFLCGHSITFSFSTVIDFTFFFLLSDLCVQSIIHRFSLAVFQSDGVTNSILIPFSNPIALTGQF
jgi:hypothetical protein